MATATALQVIELRKGHCRRQKIILYIIKIDISLYIHRVAKSDETCENVNNRGVPGGYWSTDGTELDGEGVKCSKYEEILLL